MPFELKLMRAYLFYILMTVFISHGSVGAQTSPPSKSFEVHVLPGIGIVIENDSIKLFKTSVEQLKSLLSVKLKPGLIYRTACGFTEDGDPFSVETVIESFTYKNITFNYEGLDTTALELNEVELVYDSTSKVIVANKFELGAINPNIRRHFQRKRNCDYFFNEPFEPIKYEFYSKGIIFELSRKGNKKLLTTVRVLKGERN
jgi:hypothetical protein